MIQLFVVGVVTALVVLAAAALGMFMMILGLNGFSESEAKPMLIAYVVLALMCVLGAAAASGLGARAVASAKRWSMWAVGPLAVVAASVMGCSVLFVGSFFIILLGAAIVR